jgi:hypothetical protein
LRGGNRIAETRARADHETFDAATGLDLHTHDREKGPASEPLNGCSDQRAAYRRTGNERDAAHRARNRLRNGQARSDACTANCPARQADPRKDGNNIDGRGAAWSSRKQHAAQGARDDAGEAAPNRCSRPALRDHASRAADSDEDQLSRNGQRRRRAEHGHLAGLRGVPSRVAKQRTCRDMPGSLAKPAQRFAGSERMEQLGRFAPILFFEFVAWNARHTVEQRFKRICGCDCGVARR